MAIGAARWQDEKRRRQQAAQAAIMQNLLRAGQIGTQAATRLESERQRQLAGDRAQGRLDLEREAGVRAQTRLDLDADAAERAGQRLEADLDERARQADFNERRMRIAEAGAQIRDEDAEARREREAREATGLVPKARVDRAEKTRKRKRGARKPTAPAAPAGEARRPVDKDIKKSQIRMAEKILGERYRGIRDLRDLEKQARTLRAKLAEGKPPGGFADDTAKQKWEKSREQERAALAALDELAARMRAGTISADEAEANFEERLLRIGLGEDQPLVLPPPGDGIPLEPIPAPPLARTSEALSGVLGAAPAPLRPAPPPPPAEEPWYAKLWPFGKDKGPPAAPTTTGPAAPAPPPQAMAAPPPGGSAVQRLMALPPAERKQAALRAADIKRADPSLTDEQAAEAAMR